MVIDVLIVFDLWHRPASYRGDCVLGCWCVRSLAVDTLRYSVPLLKRNGFTKQHAASLKDKY